MKGKGCRYRGVAGFNTGRRGWTRGLYWHFFTSPVGVIFNFIITESSDTCMVSCVSFLEILCVCIIGIESGSYSHILHNRGYCGHRFCFEGGGVHSHFVYFDNTLKVTFAEGKFPKR